jgi:hypothetical protein
MRLTNLSTWTVALVVFLALLLALAYGFRKNIYEATINPGVPFPTMVPPPAPDYARPGAWAALPQKVDGADLVPEGPASGAGTVPAALEADIFFLHPTTSDSNDGWNLAHDEPRAADLVDAYVLPYQASAFNAAGRVFVPRYRQATHYAFRTRGFDGRAARAFPYRDVRAAFASFLERIGPDRPFVLAGQEQGAFHLVRLMQEVLRDPALKARLVAAYVLGTALPEDVATAALGGVPLCASADESGCALAYIATHDPDRARDRYMIWQGNDLRVTEGLPLVCATPLPYTAREVDGGMAGQGALTFDDDARQLPQAIPQAVTARCRGGYLRIEDLAGALGRSPLPREEGRRDEIRLFWSDIRQDAQARVAGWYRRSQSSGPSGARER